MLDTDQTKAFEGALAFVAAKNPSTPHYSIHGLAGTGKSYVAAHIYKALPNCIPCCFTAKAASVLRARGVPAKTIHSVIYNFSGEIEDEVTGKKQPVFQPKGDPLARTTILLDEDSMVGDRIADDLKATGARILTTGDPGQLPPVRDSQHFTDAHAMLRQPHRQALESPIIRQAYHVRNFGSYEYDTDDFRVVEKTTDTDRNSVNIALCYRNATRQIYNRVRRSDAGLPSNSIKAGEPIMCLKNNHDLGIYNGVIYTVGQDWFVGDPLVLKEDITNKVIVCNNAVCESFGPTPEDMEGITPFALAYAVTVHKAQGSEWPNVLVIDEHPQNVQWEFWAYTAITRAAKKITMVKR